ncbi:MAG: hypothetical protein EON51_16230 [Acinetobacter sp.]|nr:MAG: hypothetical protein EON51_16230 [Acinetobacter sp.]
MEKRRNGTRSISIVFLVSAEEQQAIEQICERLGNNKSEMIRDSIFNPKMLSLDHSKLLMSLSDIGREIEMLNRKIGSQKQSKSPVERDDSDFDILFKDYLILLGEVESLIRKLLHRIRKRE